MTLILGGSGQLGSELRRLLPEASAPARVELDLADVTQLRAAIVVAAPDGIINCAAYTSVDAAEENEDQAVLINGAAVGEMAAAADDLGIPFVTFSTDYVFDGRSGSEYVESSNPAPLNAYGRSKVIGEQLALKYPGSLVIRTSWLLSATHRNFLTTILRTAADGAVQVVDDQWGRPTLVPDLAAAVVRALDARATGIRHLASPPTTTWFALATAACDAAGLDAQRITRSTSNELSSAAKRPRYSGLATTYEESMPDWRAGLAQLAAEAAAGAC